MEQPIQTRIDAYTHILPNRYREALYKKTRRHLSLDPLGDMKAHHDMIPGLFDIEHRFRMMEGREGLQQVLTMVNPPLETVVSPQDAVDLAKLANDEMAELIVKYPERFIAGVACLPMNNIEQALKETERAISELGFRGIQLHTPCGETPLDSREFMPIYELMAQFDLPIWIHPVRSRDTADYSGEDHSLYRIFHIFGWPFETTAAMARLVFSGILEQYPNLKIITHHCGAMVPYFSQRLAFQGQGMVDKQQHYDEATAGLSRPVLECFKMFYADTAINGNTAAFMCAYDFFGPDHVLFGTDMPYPGAKGLIKDIEAVEAMSIPDSDKQKIFEGNARRLLRL